jgi:putative oxidoreductase
MQTLEDVMKPWFSLAERLAGPCLRISLGLVLLWIGFIHLVTPQPVVRLLWLSLPFLAQSAFVYGLGALEVLVGLLLIARLWVRYAALLSLVLFAGTLTIFVIAPGVTGFPVLTLMGQFLLKDLVLASAAITVMARDAASHQAKRAQHPQLSRRSRDHITSQ